MAPDWSQADWYCWDHGGRRPHLRDEVALDHVVRAQLHRSRLVDARAIDAAQLFADRIDDPTLLARLHDLESEREKIDVH